MDRKILFKAKRKNKGGWIEGYYFSEIGKHFICQLNDGGSIEVFPETVCQFTGLKDKNGKDVFEGDKCKSHSRAMAFVIVWSNGGFWGRNEIGSMFRVDEFELRDAKIIGNIHDEK